MDNPYDALREIEALTMLNLRRPDRWAETVGKASALASIALLSEPKPLASQPSQIEEAA